MWPFFYSDIFGNANPFCTDVSDLQHFALSNRIENICLEEIPADQPFERIKEDNFALSLKINLHPDTNNKVIGG